MEFKLPQLPPKISKLLEAPQVVKQLAKASRSLGELKGTAKTIPNKNILIDTLTLQEAKNSSEIENIVTTHDDLYKENLYQENIFIESKSSAAKEVYNYARALKLGFQTVREQKFLINKNILTIQKELIGNDAGFRTQAGTKLIDNSRKTVYTPPQDPDNIVALMANLEKYMNDDDFSGDVDPLIKMAVIHYQFESIHPFYDGNGRTGRMINILYLVQKSLLDTPILYLSRYIIQNKAQYYKVLQDVRTNNDWESLILYFLKAVEFTAIETIDLITEIGEAMKEYKLTIRKKLPNIYSQDLINHLFKHPYTKRIFLEKDLQVSRGTANTYLGKVTELGLLEKLKIGKINYYINSKLIEIVQKV